MKFVLKAGDLVLLKRWIWWTIFCLILIPSQLTQACSLRPLIEIRCEVDSALLKGPTVCMDEECTLRVEKNEHGVNRIFMEGEDIIGWVDQDSVEFSPYERYPKPDFKTLNNFCTADLVGDSGAIEQLYLSWDIKRDYSFEINPYSLPGEQHLSLQDNNLLDCIGRVSARDGDWLASYKFERDYCNTSFLPVSMCGGILIISPINFVLFSFANPGPQTYSYIIAASVAILFFAASLFFLNRRGIMKEFFQLSQFKKRALAFAIPLLCIVTLINIQYTLLLLIVYYYLLSTIQYLWNSRRGMIASSAEK